MFTTNAEFNENSVIYKNAPNCKYSILTLQIQDIHVHSMPETLTRLCQLTSLMVICLLLPWCTVITDYILSSSNNYL